MCNFEFVVVVFVALTLSTVPQVQSNVAYSRCDINEVECEFVSNVNNVMWFLWSFFLLLLFY